MKSQTISPLALILALISAVLVGIGIPLDGLAGHVTSFGGVLLGLVAYRIDRKAHR